jgi:hypothetical protein
MAQGDYFEVKYSLNDWTVLCFSGIKWFRDNLKLSRNKRIYLPSPVLK